MTTLQEQLNRKYPTKEDRENIKDINSNEIGSGSERGELDLSEYKGLEKLILPGNKIISVNFSGCKELTIVNLVENDLTSVDFLNTIPNPEKLESLSIFDNNIQPTDISFFSKFINLKYLKIGTRKPSLEKGKHNQFYGSLKSYQNLTKLEDICIEATDVNEGLEYLPESLAKAIKKNINGNYSSIECSPHDTNAKCSQIQDQLRPFNYDLEA